MCFCCLLCVRIEKDQLLCVHCLVIHCNLLFVSQLYEDKSLALHARDLIFFTTDLQTVNYYSTMLEVIYFLNTTISDRVKNMILFSSLSRVRVMVLRLFNNLL